MGEFRNIDAPENREHRLIQMLKERGIEDPETKALLLAWADALEQKAQQSEGNQAYIQVDIEKGRLYAAAGYMEEAYHSFIAAREMAWNERLDELVAQIEQEMDERDL